MKKEYVEEVLKALKKAEVISDYEDVGSNIFLVGYRYIALNKKNQLESNQKKIEARLDILDLEKELEESKKAFKEKYQEDYK